MGGGWAIDTGTYQTPNMDMKRHIKGHQTLNIDTPKNFKDKLKPTSKHFKAYYIRNYLSCHSTFGSKAHNLGSEWFKENLSRAISGYCLVQRAILPCAEGNILPCNFL